METTLFSKLKGKPLGHFNLTRILKDVKSGRWVSEVLDVRKWRSINREKYEEEKKLLPCFTPSGTFGAKKYKSGKFAPPAITGLIEYTGVVVLDYDKGDAKKIEEALLYLPAVETVRAVFTSVSGIGFKVFIPTTNRDPQQHYNAYTQVADHFDNYLGLEVDRSGSNVSRLCFVGSDPNIYIAKEWKEFPVQAMLLPVETRPKVKPTVQKEKTSNGIYTEEGDFLKAIERTEKSGRHYIKGQRREFVKRLSTECFKFGLEEEIAWNFINIQLVTVQCDADNLRKLVRDIYNKINSVNPQQFGMYAEWRKEHRPLSTTLSVERSSPTVQEESKKYVPQLYKESASKEEHIDIVRLTFDDVQELEDTKLSGRIKFQRLLEKKLKDNFEFRINILEDREEYKFKTWNEFKPISDIDYNSIALALLHSGFSCQIKDLKMTVRSHFAKMVHPIRDYLKECSNGLPSVAKRDYIKEVATLVPTTADKWLWEVVFKKWVVASVANAFIDRKCANQLCLTLCSPEQGTNKTSFISSLFPSEWVYTGQLDLKSKDHRLLLTNSFIILLDEQMSLLHKDVNEWEAFKTYVSMPSIKERRVYAKSHGFIPRLANMAGTANRIEFLPEDTGQRRIAPFLLSDTINLKGLTDELLVGMWGQAYQLYKEGFFYLLDEKEEQALKIYRRQFERLEDFELQILDDYQPWDGKDEKERVLLSSTELRRKLVEDKIIVNTVALGRAMRNRLGFKQSTLTRADGKKSRFWHLQKK